MEIYVVWERHWDFEHSGNGPVFCDPIVIGSDRNSIRRVQGFDTLAKARKALREYVKEERARWKIRRDPDEKWVSLPRKIVPGVYYPMVKLHGVTATEEVAIRVIEV